MEKPQAYGNISPHSSIARGDQLSALHWTCLVFICYSFVLAGSLENIAPICVPVVLRRLDFSRETESITHAGPGSEVCRGREARGQLSHVVMEIGKH